MDMLTYGTDPEVFSCIENDLVISPALLEKFSNLKPVKGDKKHPVYIDTAVYSWHMDGVAFELMFKAPLYSAKEMYQSIKFALNHLEEFLSDYKFFGNELKLVKKPTVNINPEMYLPLLKDEKIKQGFIFGCDRDFDAILTDYICDTLDVSKYLFRHGGGHWHTGVPKEKLEVIHARIVPYIQLQSIYLGNGFLSRSKYLEEEKLRSKSYGNPGRYRPQNWGTEYRTPSNSWLEDEETIDLLVEGTNRAYELISNPNDALEIINNFLPKTINAIVNADQNLSKEILNEVK